VIKSVILDYGLVLCRAPEREMVDQISRVFDLDSAQFWALYDRNRGVYDRGDMSPEQYWRSFAVDAGVTLSPTELKWLRKCDIEMWSCLEEHLLAWVDELRAAGYKTSILSNLNKEFAMHMRSQCDWIQRFDFQVFSAEIRRIKPEPEIYRHCLQLLDCSPDQAIFIDDREANVAAARNEGIVSLLYRSTGQLRMDLEVIGFDVLPATDSGELTHVPTALL
jgi:putative hydrolase of the HAD superfamily